MQETVPRIEKENCVRFSFVWRERERETLLLIYFLSIRLLLCRGVYLYTTGKASSFIASCAAYIGSTTKKFRFLLRQPILTTG